MCEKENKVSAALFKKEEKKIPRSLKISSEGFWRVPFEDPLWNFKRGGGAPLRPPPHPESAIVHQGITIYRYNN